MRIDEVTFRHRNDFKFWSECEACGHRTHYGDGYADAYYCQVVVPARACPKCGLSSNDISDARAALAAAQKGE